MSWNNPRGGLAHNPPYVIPVQVDQALYNATPLFTGYVMDYIVSKAQQNQARALFQQLAEQDQNLMGMMVQDLANATEFFYFSENQTPGMIEATIRNLVGVVVDAYLGFSINHYPNDFGPLLDQQAISEAQRYIGDLEQLKRQAQLFYNGGRGGNWQGNQQSNSWQPNQQRGGGRGQNWQNQQANYSRWDEPVQHQQQPQGGSYGYRQSTQDNWPGNRMPNNRMQGNRGPARSTPFEEAPVGRNGGTTNASTGTTSARPRREFLEPRQVQPERQRVVAPINPRQTVVGNVTFVPAGENEWPKVMDPKRIFDWVLLQDGTQLRPAHLSDWKVSFDPEAVATPWYNPQTHLLMHVKTPDGRVRAEPFKRESAMDYLDHELDPALRKRAQDEALKAGGKVEAAWNLVEQLRPNPSSPLATAEPLGEDAEGHQVRPLNPGDYLTTNSLPDAIKRAVLKLKVDHPDVLNQAFELYVDRGVLTEVANPDFDLLFKLSTTESFKSLFHLLIDSAADEDLIKAVDKRVAQHISSAMQYHLGLRDWSIDSFQDDYGELLAALKQDYGQSVVEALEGYAIEIISRALAYYPEDELSKIRSAVGLEEGLNALVWRERSSVTRLPVTAQELAVADDKGVLISETNQPELYRTLSSIYERTEDLPLTFHGRYLATSDGVVYQLARGYLNDQALMLYKAAFVLK